jgi:hypothetical protein
MAHIWRRGMGFKNTEGRVRADILFSGMASLMEAIFS